MNDKETPNDSVQQSQELTYIEKVEKMAELESKGPDQLMASSHEEIETSN